MNELTVKQFKDLKNSFKTVYQINDKIEKLNTRRNAEIDRTCKKLNIDYSEYNHIYCSTKAIN